MEDAAKKILFVSSEMFPYLPETGIAKICRELPQGIQERGKEIRAFMPRYGCINERKNQLHEVIRLSGMNIIIGDVDRPLVIKVASISSARIQVYFIDNEDYFRRKRLSTEENGTPFADNGERAIFFARGVLETVKKLRWAPDIIHCSGWISHVLPLYLKKVYKDDPIFAHSKIVLSLFDDMQAKPFAPGLDKTVLMGSIKPRDVMLPDPADGTELAKLAIRYSDGVIMGSGNIPSSLDAYARELSLPVLPFDAEAFGNGAYLDSYNAFYDNLLK
ncbi:MAG: glycogen/starch synthase [Bacteroidales bacterium]|nr:glycogen/starch synthase [Bacteroidales bacterium]